MLRLPGRAAGRRHAPRAAGGRTARRPDDARLREVGALRSGLPRLHAPARAFLRRGRAAAGVLAPGHQRRAHALPGVRRPVRAAVLDGGADRPAAPAPRHARGFAPEGRPPALARGGAPAGDTPNPRHVAAEPQLQPERRPQPARAGGDAGRRRAAHRPPLAGGGARPALRGGDAPPGVRRPRRGGVDGARPARGRAALPGDGRRGARALRGDALAGGDGPAAPLDRARGSRAVPPRRAAGCAHEAGRRAGGTGTTRAAGGCVLDHPGGAPAERAADAARDPVRRRPDARRPR